MTSMVDESLVKPLLRGWFHAIAAGVALVFTCALCWRTRSDTTRIVVSLIYGLSMVQLFTISAIYHIGRWRGAVRRRLNALDHANIFILIAGTYTPLCAILLSGWLQIVILTVVWIQAGIGVWLSRRTTEAPVWVVPVLCVGMGWVGILAVPALLAVLPAAAMTLLLLGGGLYTLGAVVFAVRWPDPFPRVFGFHEIFHVLSVAAAASFAITIWIWVVSAAAPAA